MAMCLSLCLCVRQSGDIISAECLSVYRSTNNDLCACWSSHSVCLAGYLMAVHLSLCLAVCELDGVVLSSVQNAAECCKVYSSTTNYLCVSLSSHCVCLGGYAMASVCRCVCVCLCVRCSGVVRCKVLKCLQIYYRWSVCLLVLSLCLPSWLSHGRVSITVPVC